jgi:hypothetical protein
MSDAITMSPQSERSPLGRALASHPIARLGGVTVESYPEDAAGRSVSSSFLNDGTLAMFERQGFRRDRRLGTNHWALTMVVERS